MRRKLAHVADALGKGDGGGPAAKQARKPLGGFKARSVVVEGEEGAGATPQALRHLVDSLGAQRCDCGEAPTGKGKPVEDPFRHDRPGRRNPKTPKSKQRLRAGQRLEPGRPAWGDGPSDKPADKAAEASGTTHHAGEPLRAPLHEQPAVPEPVGGEAHRLKGLPQPAARRIAEAKTGCGVKTDAPRGQVLPGNGAVPELPA